jgi:hypothetical protein
MEAKRNFWGVSTMWMRDKEADVTIAVENQPPKAKEENIIISVDDAENDVKSEPPKPKPKLNDIHPSTATSTSATSTSEGSTITDDDPNSPETPDDAPRLFIPSKVV